MLLEELMRWTGVCIYSRKAKRFGRIKVKVNCHICQKKRKVDCIYASIAPYAQKPCQKILCDFTIKIEGDVTIKIESDTSAEKNLHADTPFNEHQLHVTANMAVFLRSCQHHLL